MQKHFEAYKALSRLKLILVLTAGGLNGWGIYSLFLGDPKWSEYVMHSMYALGATILVSYLGNVSKKSIIKQVYLKTLEQHGIEDAKIIRKTETSMLISSQEVFYSLSFFFEKKGVGVLFSEASVEWDGHFVEANGEISPRKVKFMPMWGKPDWKHEEDVATPSDDGHKKQP